MGEASLLPVNTRVGGKVKGFPRWPARIAALEEAPAALSQRPSPQHQLLMFYGEENYSWVARTSICEIGVLLEDLKCAKKISKKLRNAIRQVMTDVEGRGPSQQGPPNAKTELESALEAPAPVPHSGPYRAVQTKTRPLVEPVITDPFAGGMAEDWDGRVEVDLSQALERRVLNDYDLITNEKKLVPLPAKVPVDTILASFMPKVPTMEQSKVERVRVRLLEDFQMLFDLCLGSLLLYKFERPQYCELTETHEGKRPSLIYGAEHLLRMLLKIPLIWERASVGMEPSATRSLQILTTSLLDYLEAFPELFAGRYDDAAPAYVRSLN